MVSSAVPRRFLGLFVRVVLRLEAVRAVPATLRRLPPSALEVVLYVLRDNANFVALARPVLLDVPSGAWALVMRRAVPVDGAEDARALDLDGPLLALGVVGVVAGAQLLPVGVLSVGPAVDLGVAVAALSVLARRDAVGGPEEEGREEPVEDGHHRAPPICARAASSARLSS